MDCIVVLLTIKEEEKRVANMIAKKDEGKKRVHGRITHLKEKKRIAINNAQRQWEKFHISTAVDDESNIVTKSESSSSKNSMSETLIQSETPFTMYSASTGEQEEGRSDFTICHLAELEGETLYLYGPGSLDALDRNWGQQIVNTVTTIAFKFIDYDDIVPHLGKIHGKYPVIQNLIFANTNITSLQQINALAVIKHLECLTINHGNPVTSFALWKPYILFRLAHLSLRQLNDIEVTREDKVKAEKLFGSLSHVTTSYLPQSRLLSLLGETSKQQNLSEKVKRAEGKHERSLSNEGLGLAGLQYRTSDMLKSKEEELKISKNFSENYGIGLLQTCVGIHHTNKKLETLWPKVLSDMVQEYVQDMAHLDTFMGKSLENV